MIKLLGGPERIIAADTNQGMQAKTLNRLLRLADDLWGICGFSPKTTGLKMALAGRPDDRTARGGDPLRIFERERPVIPGEKKPLVTIDETEHFPPEGMGRNHGRTNHRV